MKLDGLPRQKYKAYLAERKQERKEMKELGAIRYSELGDRIKEKSDVVKELKELRKKQKTGIVDKKKRKEDEDSDRNGKKRFLENL